MTVHSEAVEAAIEAAGAHLTDVDKPLIELARILARQMDAAGPDGPGTRLAAAYLTTVRTLSATIGTPSLERPGSKLGRLRATNAGNLRSVPRPKGGTA